MDAVRSDGAPRRLSLLAALAFLFGLLFFVLFAGLIAIILGIVALRRIGKSEGRFAGKRLAICAIVLGSFVTTAQVAWISLYSTTAPPPGSRTELSLRIVQQALENYNFTNGAYPTTNQGIAALVPGQLHNVNQDEWRQDFAYYAPTGDPERPYELYSLGRDGQAKTADDISVWDIDR